MNNQGVELDIVSLERSVFRRTLSHGLIDIAIACVPIIFAVGPYTTGMGLGDFWGSAVFIPFWGLAALVLRSIYRHTVVPRLGHVVFARPRIRRLLTWNIIVFAICVIALGVGVISGSQFGLIPPIFHMVALAIFILAGFGLAAYYLESTRFYLYGLVIASAPFTGELLWKYAGVPHHGYPVTFGFAAVLCFSVGVGLLIRFVSRHPLPPGNVDSLGV